LILDLDFPVLISLGAVALLTGFLHGASGLAGGIVMASVLAHFVGIKAAVPAMTAALICSHLSRAIIYSKDTDWAIVKRVLLFGGPMIVVGALVFSRISATTIAVVFALFLASSFPVRYWAEAHEIRTGPKLLAGASMLWGLLAGNVIGPGFFLAPFLLGTGMSRLTFVGTLASVTLVMNMLKLAVFGVTDLVSQELLVLGVAIGLLTIPGNWAGRAVLRRATDRHHRAAVDILTILMIMNFIYLALQ
jgi:uncharacterized membrane protein YfcA